MDTQSSKAFVEEFTVKPYKSGCLDGLSFAVKDNINLKDHRTSYGSKPWRDLHEESLYNALCVDQLLAEGATCLGKTIADEYTYSLSGEGSFWETALNGNAPDRIPGGSSSGSASAVSCKVVDFSIGTDSAGSVRVPASFCGVLGMRPSMHRISEAGVIPFMPSTSTVGAFANNIDILERVMRVLLSSGDDKVDTIRTIYILKDVLDIADEPVRRAFEESVSHLYENKDISLKTVTLSEIVGEPMTLDTCNRKALRILQTTEFGNTVGEWVEQNNPELGRIFGLSYRFIRNFDRTDLNKALFLSAKLRQRISSFPGRNDLFLYPTTPTVAPLKGSLDDPDTVAEFYNRTMAVTSFAGVSRIPELSLPITRIDDVPIGISLAGGVNRDEFVLKAARELFMGSETFRRK